MCENRPILAQYVVMVSRREAKLNERVGKPKRDRSPGKKASLYWQIWRFIVNERCGCFPSKNAILIILVYTFTKRS